MSVKKPHAINYRAIIFDLEGTLLDTLQDLGESMNQVLMNLGFATHNLEAHKYFVGDGVEMDIRRALPIDARSDESVQQCFAIYWEEYGWR